MKKIFIDCQILQTQAYDRGMGKYSLSLLEALFRLKEFKSGYDVVLLFNKNLPLTKEKEKEIVGRVGFSNTAKVDLPVDISQDAESKYTLARNQLTKAISSRINNDERGVFFILSPFFMGFPAVFPNLENIEKVCLVYDLIPYLVWRQLKIFPDDIYFKHYELFLEADGLLTISEAAKQDLVSIIGIDEKKVANINGGPFEREGSSGAAREKVDRPYILCPSAPIMHKNNANTVKGFEEFNKRNGNRYKLLLTSTFDEQAKEPLAALSSNLIFTGNVNDAELAGLYEGCEAVIFGSLAEGLGMPVLEGVLYDKPVACSNINVLTEMSDKAFYVFDPRDVHQISTALDDAIGKKDWHRKRQSYREIRQKYRWTHSAEGVAGCLKEVENRKRGAKEGRLMLISPYPDYGDPAGRFVEMAYASFVDRFNDVSVQFHSSRGQKRHSMPAYTPYVAKDMHAEGANSLTIRLSTKREGYLSTGQESYTVSLYIYKNYGPWWHALLGHRKRIARIKLTAHGTLLNQVLDLPGWKYYNEQGDEMAAPDVVWRIGEFL